MTKVIDVSEVDEIQVINIRPGDTLVIRPCRKIPVEALSQISYEIKSKLDCNCLFLDEGVDLESVLRREEKQ